MAAKWFNSLDTNFSADQTIDLIVEIDKNF